MYRYFGFYILLVDLVFQFLFSLWKVTIPRPPPPPQDPAETTHASCVCFSNVPLKTALPEDVLILLSVANLHSELAAMCKRRSSFFPRKKIFLHVVVYICLDGKGMAAALSMWRASFSFNAMCIMQ